MCTSAGNKRRDGPRQQKKALRALLCAGLLAAAGWVQGAEPAGLLSEFGRARALLMTTAGGCVLLDVYVADERPEWSQGLMFIRSMTTYEGMIFIYPGERELSMWMKNTVLPLDMLFVDNAGRISHLHRDAVPQSTAIISSGGAVRAVVELNAGSIERFGIQRGDRVLFPAG